MLLTEQAMGSISSERKAKAYSFGPYLMSSGHFLVTNRSQRYTHG